MRKVKYQGSKAYHNIESYNLDQLFAMKKFTQISIDVHDENLERNTANFF